MTTVPETPHLLLDPEVARHNARATAALGRQRGVRVRPHVKTHKSPDLARLQVEEGALGLTVATLGEAEVFAHAGFEDLFVAYPVWPSPAHRERAGRLAARVRLSIGVESVEAAAGWSGSDVGVLIEVDSGHHRTGVLPQDAGPVAAAASAAGLRVEGVFTFPGHGYLPGDAVRAAHDEAAALLGAAASCAAAGVPVEVLSGGSTPTLATAVAGPTELRPGVSVLGDAQQWELGHVRPEDIALVCIATVVSRRPGRVVLDAGSKALGADRAPWATGFGRLLDLPEARIVSLSEHHAVVDLAGARSPGLGERVRVVPNHVCNAVNLHDVLHLVGGGAWPVAARGHLA